MIYSFSFSSVALVLGLIYLASHGWALWRPKQAREFLAWAPRSYVLGVILMAVGIAWFAWVLGTVPLMEYGPHRERFQFFAVVVGVLTMVSVRDFLAVRAIGVLLLLLAELMLEAAFPPEPVRLLLTVTAYVYVVLGCIWVSSPYLMRDWIEWLNRSEGRVKAAAAGGVVFGVILLVLAWLGR